MGREGASRAPERELGFQNSVEWISKLPCPLQAVWP